MVSANPAAQRKPSDAYLGASWAELCRRVNAWRPDVVVLVARKMPRVSEYLRFDFGRECLVISDLAIPFAHRELRRARVAIVDDVVNVGTTVRHACDCALASGAMDARVFALGRSQEYEATVPLECAHPDVLPAESYRKLVRWIPSALRTLAKPFEVEFPVIRCRFALPFNSSVQILRWLRDRFGSECVHDLTAGHPLRRVTVDLPNANAENTKLRLYLDDGAGVCNLVPFAVPQSLSCFPAPGCRLARQLLVAGLKALESCPPAAQLWEEESTIRLQMFASSLDAGVGALDDLGEVLVATQVSVCDPSDARLLFGPRVAEALNAAPNPASIDPYPLPSATPVRSESETLPFFSHCDKLAEHHFLDLVRRDASASDPCSIFASVFDALARLVGALDPSKYALTWPYSYEDIARRPYLRLRIGPTFQDLVAIMDALVPDDLPVALPTRNLVSAMLDDGIDSGAVVPTIAHYDGHAYRIYRKGENDLRDEAVDRIAYAWLNYGKPMTLTRLAKINAILAYSNCIPQTLVPCTLERGNSASLQTTSLDLEGPELGEYMRRIGRITRTDKK